MENKRRVAIPITAVIFGAVVGVALIWMDYFSDYSNVLKINWELSLPHDAAYSEVYSQSSESTFNGDGTRYHVFTYVNTTPISEMLAWQSTERKTLYSGSYSAAVEDWLDKLGVPANERPVYENCSYWYQSQADNSEIIILWGERENKLYVVESFL